MVAAVARYGNNNLDGHFRHLSRVTLDSTVWEINSEIMGIIWLESRLDHPWIHAFTDSKTVIQWRISIIHSYLEIIHQLNDQFHQSDSITSRKLRNYRAAGRRRGAAHII